MSLPDELQSPSSDPPARHKRWLYWTFAAVAWCVLVLLFDLAAMHAAPYPTSDQASVVLEGQSLAHGNVLLHRWSLSLDSFWTAEVPFYGVASLLIGLSRLQLTLVPAVIGACIVGVAVLIASHGRRRAGGIVAGATVVAVVGLPVHALARFMLVGGAHVGALLWALIAFYALRKGRWGAGVVVAACSLTLGMLGDLLTLAYGTAPIFVAGGLAMLRCRSLRSGLPAVVAAAGACLLALAIRAIATVIGTFSIGSANALATLRQADSNLRHVYSLAGNLLGARTAAYGTGGAPAWLSLTHLVAAVVIVVAVVLYLARLVVGLAGGPPHALAAEDAGSAESSPGELAAPTATGGRAGQRPVVWWQPEPSAWTLDDMLFAGVIGGTGSYVALSTTSNLAFARYLTAAVVFAVVLAARAVGRAWDDADGTYLRTAFAVAGVALIASFATGFAYTVTARVPPQPAVAFAGWLEAHHLTNGVGAYWASNIVTVSSGDDVHVRPVKAVGGKLRRYGRESTAAWYSGQEFTFIVYNRGQPAGGVSSKTATVACGPLAQTDTVDGYIVYVCVHPFTISPTPS